jgi:hypothetical protein
MVKSGVRRAKGKGGRGGLRMKCPHCGTDMNTNPVDEARGSKLVSCPNNCEAKRYEVKENEG